MGEKGKAQGTLFSSVIPACLEEEANNIPRTPPRYEYLPSGVVGRPVLEGGEITPGPQGGAEAERRWGKMNRRREITHEYLPRENESHKWQHGLKTSYSHRSRPCWHHRLRGR